MLSGRIHHVGVATPSIEAAVSIYRDVLGLSPACEPFALPDHGVRVCFLPAAETQIELIEPWGNSSPLRTFLEQHPAGGQHHLCFEVSDLTAAVATAKDKGIIVIGEPRIGAHGTPVIFLHPRTSTGVLIELMQSEPSRLEAWRRFAPSEAMAADTDLDSLTVGKLKPLYTIDDILGKDPGLPGLAPFLRGIHASMYIGRPWTIRQYKGFSTAEASNVSYRNALKDGKSALSVAFDLPTHRGYDSDHPNAAGEVGKAGVAIDTVEDMKRLFQEIPLESTSVSMTMSGAVIPILAFFIVGAEERGISADQLMGTIQNDILKEFMVRNTYIYPLHPSLRIVRDVFTFISARMPKFNSISVSGYHMHEAGATPVQELAFTIANALEYVRMARAAGLDIEQFAQRISFFFAIGMEFFSEVAKLRAARKLWYRVMTELGVRNDRSKALRMHCQTSGVSLTERDPYNNVVRTTLEALAAALGGTQSLHTNSFDEALSLPSEHASRIALHTQFILQEETGITGVIDPLGGSYYVEALTNRLYSEAGELVDRIEREGGMVRAVADGWPRVVIEEAAVLQAAKVDLGERKIVGVNIDRSASEPQAPSTEYGGEATRMEQITHLNHVKAGRKPAEVHATLVALRDGANSDDNLLELAIRCARARATLGEITLAMESVFGRHKTSRKSLAGLYGEVCAQDVRWMMLTEAVSSYTKRKGRKARMLVAKLGQDGHDRGANLVTTVFRDLGFEVHEGPLFQKPDEVSAAAVAADVDVVGVSSLVGSHALLVPELMEELRDKGRADIKVIIGGIIPIQDRQALHNAGVQAIFGPGTNLVEAAAQVLQLLGENLASW